MRRIRQGTDYLRAIRMLNICNTQVSNPSELSIARVMLRHTSASPDTKPIGSLEEVAEEAHISQASVSRFVRKVGYDSYADFHDSFVAEFDELSRGREKKHAKLMRSQPSATLGEAIFAEQSKNVRATMELMGWDALLRAVQTMAKARSVLLLGDDHVLSDFFTLQLDLLACGIPAYLYKNEQAQEIHASQMESGDVVLYASVASAFVTPSHRRMVQQARELGARAIGLCQDSDAGLPDLFDQFVAFGVPGSDNRGFASLWLLSEVMSEMLYEV